MARDVGVRSARRHARTRPQEVPHVPGKNLTRDEAAGRAAILRVESYDVRLDLTTGPETFETVTTVRFSCTEPRAESFIDLIADSVEKATLNGVDLDPA